MGAWCAGSEKENREKPSAPGGAKNRKSEEINGEMEVRGEIKGSRIHPRRSKFFPGGGFGWGALTLPPPQSVRFPQNTFPRPTPCKNASNFICVEKGLL